MTIIENKSAHSWIAAERVLVELSTVAINQKDMIDKLDVINTPLRTFILIIIDLAQTNGKTEQGFHFVGRTQIQNVLKEKELGCSDALISRRLKTLCENDVCDKQIQMQAITSQAGREVNQRVNHYKIESFTPLANIIPEKKERVKKNKRITKSVIHAQKTMLAKASNGVLLSQPEDMIYFHERLFNGILDVSMRLSGQDKRDTIEVNYMVAGQPLKITSVCSSKKGSAILMMTDQRLIRVLISYCKKKIEYFRKKYTAQHGSDFNMRLIPNIFHVDIHELCDLLVMNRVNSNLDIIVGMMNRLIDTKFEVDASENKWFQEQFSAGFREVENEDGSVQHIGSDQFVIQFLTNFEAATKNEQLADIFGVEMSKLRPRYYTFSLDRRLFQSLLSANKEHLFLSHEEMAVENSGIVQRFYNWAGYHVSRRTRLTVENKWYSILDMYQFLAPGHRMDNFKRQWIRALEKYSVLNSDGNKEWEAKVEGKALVHGYYVYYKRVHGIDQFRFERDRNDHIVGDNSIHNRKNRETQQSLIFDNEQDELAISNWESSRNEPIK